MKYDHIPLNEKSIKLLLAEEKFLKIKQVVEKEQTQPEYLQALLQSLLNDLQILNEIQPLKQDISNQIQKDQRKKIEDMSIEEMIHEQQLSSYEYESFTFDDEPVMAEVNVFDEINTSELSYPGIGENVVLDEEEDSFTYTTRTFLPFVTYPEVLPVSYSTGSEDKVFNPGIFDKDAFNDKSSKELAPSKALLTLDVFDPLHPPLMDFHVTKAFSGVKFSILKFFSKKFYEPGIKNALVFRILEDSWFNIVEGQSNSHNFH
ncbi:hypothetical protein Tco_1494279 [Tanacetum coccineum]